MKRKSVRRSVAAFLGMLLAVVMTGGIAGVSSSASAATTFNESWSMSPEGTVVHSASGNFDLTTHGTGWQPAQGPGGVDGTAIDFTAAATSVVAEGSADLNPRTENFALGVLVKPDSLPSVSGYSGNIGQKGYATRVYGQVKLSYHLHNGIATVSCRVKGTNDGRTAYSNVSVDDSNWHRVICFRDGAYIGVSVDGVVKRREVNTGDIVNPEPVRFGNKSDSADLSDQYVGDLAHGTWKVSSDAFDQTVIELANADPTPAPTEPTPTEPPPTCG